MEEDPEFLELSKRQQRAVDRAFERGVRLSKGRPSKRRRLDHQSGTGTATPATPVTPADAGGFLDDDGGGGGFLPDDDAGGFIADDGGGFLPEDDGGGFVPYDDGGFIPEDDAGPSTVPSAGPSTAPNTRATSPADDRIPLRLIPTLLSSLGLASDEDVLSVFRAIGEGEASDSGVRRKDFRAVCAALMPPDDPDGGDEGDDDDEPDAGEGGAYEDEDVEMSSGSDEDEFEPDDDDDDEYGAPAAKARRTRRERVLEEKAAPKLSPRQREGARALWALLKPDAKGPGGGILSRDEVKRWARELGEMWSDAEVGCSEERCVSPLTVDHRHGHAVLGAA